MPPLFPSLLNRSHGLTRVGVAQVVRLGDGVAVDNDNAEAMQSKLMHIQFAFHVETEHVVRCASLPDRVVFLIKHDAHTTHDAHTCESVQAWTLVCSSEQEKQAWLSIVRQGATNAKKV